MNYKQTCIERIVIPTLPDLTGEVSEDDYLHTITRRAPIRPKYHRIGSGELSSRRDKCSRCGLIGKNWRSCKEVVIMDEPEMMGDGWEREGGINQHSWRQKTGG